MKLFTFVLLILFISACANESTVDQPSTEEVENNSSEQDKDTTADNTIEPTQPDEIIVLETPSSAYINDPEPNGPTNVRATPNNGAIILELPKNEDTYMFSITAKSGRWFRISDLSGIEKEIELPNNEGWVHGSLIEYGLRNDAATEVTLYESADQESKATLIKDFKNIKLVDITAEWMEVSCQDKENKVYQGWIKRDDLCGSPLTTCS
ncbi:MAG: hypothetical protein GY810_19040 [Aureispira sp.]|nr:hypothetical protein [Aureispira sp.]